MDRRLTYEEKGKVIAKSNISPPRIRIRGPRIDTTDLIKKNELTLIGRLTNPKVQRMWSMISYFTRTWELSRTTENSDLGNGLFQFRFTREDDLAKRPYHFSNWMVIIQKWEPVISPSFQSHIPFSIQLKGIPLHYWNKKMSDNIEEALGNLEGSEITANTARIRVTINDVQPLIQETIIDFGKGDEAKNYCVKCYCLTHEEADCNLTQPGKAPTNKGSPSQTISKAHKV